MESKGIKGSDILSLLEKQGYKCAYSGEELTPDNTSADHRIPVTDGGSHTIDNIALVTRQINAAKGTMSLDEFVEMCKKVAFHMGQMSDLEFAAEGLLWNV